MTQSELRTILPDTQMISLLHDQKPVAVFLLEFYARSTPYIFRKLIPEFQQAAMKIDKHLIVCCLVYLLLQSVPADARYSGIIIDADAGHVLYASEVNQHCYPQLLH